MPDRRCYKGKLIIDVKSFDYNGNTRERPVKVQGRISAYTNPPDADPPLAYFPGANTGNGADPMEGCDKGHVIQCSVSNISDPENIVPMYPCFNQAGGIWKELETRIKTYNTDYSKPGKERQVEMTVDIEYTGHNDPRFPTAFVVTVFDHSNQGGHLYFKGMKLENYRVPHLPTPAVLVDPEKELGTWLYTSIRIASDLCKCSDWKVESLYPQNPPKLAPLDEVTVRPYAMLDYLWLEYKCKYLLNFLTDGCTYKHTHAAQFHERQKQLIRLVNRMFNNGYLKSDYPNDTKEALIVGSGKRSAQVDHVLPFNNMGPNLFSNALIASGDFNNKARASTPSAKWAAKPTLEFYATNKHQ
jgi:hypothetical protein